MQSIPVELIAWVTAAGSLFGSGWLAAIRIVAKPLEKRLDASEAEMREINSTLRQRWLTGSNVP